MNAPKIKDMGMGSYSMEMPEPAPDESQVAFISRCANHMLNCEMAESLEEATAHCQVCWDYRELPDPAAAAAATAAAQAQITKRAKSGETLRAYSLLSIKNLADEARIIEGIASTPSTDRMDDVV